MMRNKEKVVNKETVAVIHAAFDEIPHTVALVEVKKNMTTDEKLEKAFMLTNSIDDAWWNNKGVTKMFGDASCRSTSTGDMVLVGTDKYMCDTAGWTKV
jgi:hypothetical protein